MNQVDNVTQKSNEVDSQFNDVTQQANAKGATKMNQVQSETQYSYEVDSQSQNVTHDENANDVRLAPNPRKHAKLWQIYLWWNDLVKMRVRHTNRLKSIERGKSNMIAEVEQDLMEQFQLDRHIKPKNKKERFGVDNILPDKSIFQLMVEAGQEVGPIWDWLTGIKGIGESLAAQILAQVDDIERFDSVAKLWRYCGYGIYNYWVDENGKAVCPKEGWKWTTIGGERYRVWTVVNSQSLDVTQGENAQNNGSSQQNHVTQLSFAIPQNSELSSIERIDYLEPDPSWKLKKLSDRLTESYHSPYNRVLKSILWNTTDMFIKHQTPVYSDLYYAEKKRLRGLYPEKMKVNGKWKYNDGHISNMALRKARKEFLKDLWLKWREFEGLSTE